jgi:PiT family inorganic phosphate transporter
MVLSPVIGLILGYLVMAAILWIFRRRHPGRATRGFRYAQTLSAAAMALGHGLQDASKTMGIIVLALTVGGYQTGSSIPLWVKISTAPILYVAGLGFGAPISTNHTITSTIMGVGATERLSAVRWGVAKNICHRMGPDAAGGRCGGRPGLCADDPLPLAPAGPAFSRSGRRCSPPWCAGSGC